MNRLARRFLAIGLAIACTLLIGTVGFTLIDHYPPFDAFYMTLTTMTTVGYAEIHPLSRAGRIFNSFLIFFGVTTIFIAIGAMTQTIIELEFGDAIGQRRNKRMIDKLKDHYIICGFGRVGRGAAAELQHAGRAVRRRGHRARNASNGPCRPACWRWRPIPRTTKPCGRSASSAPPGWWRRSPPTPTTSSSCSPPRA